MAKEEREAERTQDRQQIVTDDLDTLRPLWSWDDMLLRSIEADPGEPYKAPRGIHKAWSGYQDDRFPGHKLAARFRDGGEPDKKVDHQRRSRPQITPAQRQERKDRARELFAEGKTKEEIAAALGVSLCTATKYVQQGAWGSLDS